MANLEVAFLQPVTKNEWSYSVTEPETHSLPSLVIMRIADTVSPCVILGSGVMSFMQMYKTDC